MFDVCVVGSINLDLVAGMARLPLPGETVMGHSYAEYAGGKGLNQAVAARRGGVTVSMVGAVGPDAAGDTLVGVIDGEGIDRSELRRSAEPTGRALIGVSDDAENLIIVISGANQSVTAERVPDARVVLSQFEVPMPAIVKAFSAARGRGATTILNPAPAASAPAELLALTDIVVPNEHEVELLGGVDALLAAGVQHVVVTLGSKGAMHHRAGMAPVPVAPFRVAPVDTTGAGDCFCGSLAARIAAGDAIEVALRYAAAAAALSTTVAGAVPSMPLAASVQGLLASQG
jgi:ribokinase